LLELAFHAAQAAGLARVAELTLEHPCSVPEAGSLQLQVSVGGLDGGGAGGYSGVRYYADQGGERPADGVIFFTLDLPLSAVFDTLLLPVTPFAETERPRYGWLPGCRWAED